MEISIEDFRCFHKPSSIEIRPINILVGENSAGKTSFLAATRFILDVFDKKSRASFNKDPFHLGSYENIAHYRGGRFGRAQSFSFGVKGAVSMSRYVDRHPDLFEAGHGPLSFNYELKVKFVDRKSQPAIDLVSFEAGPYRFSLQYNERVEVVLQTPSFGPVEVDQEFSSFGSDRGTFDLSYLDIILRTYNFKLSRDAPDERTRTHSREITVLRDLYLEVLRGLPSEVYASAPVRSRPERTYNPTDFSTAADGAHIPFVLAQLNYFEPHKWESIKQTLTDFGKTSGLFEDVTVKKVGNSTGGPFQIIVNMENRKSNIIDVGYGVSQALPIITDVLRSDKKSLFLFQQPEVHLHPKAQAALGSFFARGIKRRRHTLFIETHSDHLIDRIRMHVRDGKDLRPQDVNILYFERNGHDVEIHNITIDKTGNLIGAPAGYRTFFLEEEMRSLGVDTDAFNN